MNCSQVLLFELRVYKIDNFLQSLVTNDIFEWFAAERCCVAALRAFFSFRVSHEVLVNASFAERAHAFINSVRISEKAFAQGALQEYVQVRFTNRDPIILLLCSIRI